MNKTINYRGFMMILLMCCITFSHATDYYLANNGNDNAAGTSQETCWKSMSQLQKVTLKPGDRVLFRAGDQFKGTLNVTVSGKPGKPIIFSSYGEGDKPVISGAEVLEHVQHSSGFETYKASHDIKHLFINNCIQTIARYPNTGYMTMDGGGKDYLVDDELSLQPDVARGATARMRIYNWDYEHREIIRANGNALTFDSVLFHNSRSQYKCRPGWGYYLDNKAAFLDTAGEWHYNKAESMVHIIPDKPLSQDDLIEGSYIKNGMIISSNTSYINIKNLHFSKFYNKGIIIQGMNRSIHIDSCTFSNIYRTAIQIKEGASHGTIQNNCIHDIYGAAIMLLEVTNFEVAHNVIKRIGMIPGYGIDGVNGGLGICICNNEYRPKGYTRLSHHNMIRHNRIDSVGWIGIRMDGHDNVCEFNVAKHTSCTYNDGGIFHCWGIDSMYTYNNIIRNNIFRYNHGYTKGAPNNHLMINGIYIDNNSNGIQILNNTVTDAGSGIHLNDGAFNNTIKGNTLYGNKKELSFAEWNEQRLKAVCENNYATNNILFNIFNLHHTLSIKHTYKPDYNPGYIDSNIYASPNEKYHIKKETMEEGCKITRNYTFEAWQENSDNDAHSEFIPFDHNTNSLILVNEEVNEKIFKLKKNIKYKTIHGETVQGEVTIPGFGAMILVY